MSIATTAESSTPIRTATRAAGSTTLIVAQLFTGLLMALTGIWLIVLFQFGFNGGVILVAMGAVEIALGVSSLAAVPGLRAGTRHGWVRPLGIGGAVFNVAAVMFAAAATLMVQYPGGAVVLLILFNDAILGELAVIYFLTRRAD